MSKKMKGVALDTRPTYGVGLYEDTKARLKHQALVQDYQDLQKEVDVTRKKLELAKHRKQTLINEVRFLKRRYKYVIKMKSLNSSREGKLVHEPNLVNQTTKNLKERILSSKEGTPCKLPSSPNPKPKRTGHSKKKAASKSMVPVIDLNMKERTWVSDDNALRNSTAALDLNHNITLSRNKESAPTRAPIFDLNEVSTGDEEWQSNCESLKFEEAHKGIINGLNGEQHSDFKLSVCRNSREGSSRVGKRKISWQDPVALRV
ncbi:hypothetical protein Fot_52363 [Forsythia ovata]|uniref:Uncharacterized protein n=1 Tax=Forsythia ovata TaxID=205694 RepID=A0ABD1PL51_9LAMI